MSLIDRRRVQELNDRAIRDGAYVLYRMQQSHRAELNHALEYAIEQANALAQPVVVAFGLMDDYPEANLRHYVFMLEGLRDTAARLAKRGLTFVVKRGAPASVALRLGAGASLIVWDRWYLRHQKPWRRRVAREAICRVVQVECDVIVPVHVASDRAEYAARTLRPKIHRHLATYLTGLRSLKPVKRSLPLAIPGLDLSDVDALCKRLTRDRSVPPRDTVLQGRHLRGAAPLPALLPGTARHLRGASQSAPDERRVIHERVSPFRPDLSGLARP